ncbi:hypothetical protein KJ695_01870 [Patescibacteria group bacterium]|nr:hypothetical protein [Patescibacteria group bacterium]MBU4056639.1 hypothetical protein [Patescibacteria group bacterium]MBU4368334.1 hypothetical protein [Patescibacteria group bacterium]
MDIKKIAQMVVAVSLLAVMAIATMALVSAETPPYPASDYIQDVTVGSPSDPLNYNNGGARILLTSDGDSAGLFWSGAWAISGWVIDSWEDQTGESWPYQWRSRENVATEIQYHCWIFDTTSRVTTISFYDGWMWD